MGMTDAWMVIVNPKAGSGRGLKDWPIISNRMYQSGLHFTCLFTEHKYHAIELTVQAINDGYRNIVAVGGDGTIHEVVNGIFIQKKVPTTEISLAVIPAGTGNDWIRMYGISKTYSEGVKSLVQKRTVLQDVAKVSYYETKVLHTRYMANVAGLGYDAVVNLNYNHLKDEGKYGRWLYLRSAFNTFAKYSPVKYRIVADGNEFYNGMVFSGAVGIGKCNGLMDLAIIRKMSKLRILRNFKLLYTGDIFSNPKVMHTQCKRIEIDTFPESRVEIDGEAVGTSPFVFELVPRAIKVVVGVNYVI